MEVALWEWINIQDQPMPLSAEPLAVFVLPLVDSILKVSIHF
jgi:hypothetical protein